MKKLLLLTAISSLAISASSYADTITLWTFEDKPERMAVQEEIVAQFKEKTGHIVELVPVSESKMGERAVAAFSANALPDIIYYPAMFSKAWAEAGMLNIDSNSFLVEELGEDNFAEAGLKQVRWDGSYTGVPTDGMVQMIYYRKDLFEQNNLAQPNNYKDIIAAAKALHNPPHMYGFVIPTKVDDTYMSQVLEHILMANGIDPIDKDGNVDIDEKSLREALSFYKELHAYSPPGDLYWKQSRELYFDGKAAQVFWSGALLDELGGLRDSAPITINDDPTSRELAQNTGFVTAFSGISADKEVGWGGSRIFSITADANAQVAEEFITFLVQDNFEKLLSISPENKFPNLLGDTENPNKNVDIWLGLPIGVDRFATTSEIYGENFIEQFVAGVDKSNRWGWETDQGERISRILVSFTLNRIVREYLDGKNDLDTTVKTFYAELEKIQ